MLTISQEPYGTAINRDGEEIGCFIAAKDAAAALQALTWHDTLIKSVEAMVRAVKAVTPALNEADIRFDLNMICESALRVAEKAKEGHNG